MANQVRLGITTSLRQILEKRVLPSLSPLLNNPKLDKDLQLLIQDCFPDFCRSAQNNSPPTVDGLNSKADNDFKEMDGEAAMIVSSGNDSVLSSSSPAGSATPHDPHEPVFSEDEEDQDPDDIPIATKIKLSKGKNNSVVQQTQRPIPAQLLEVSDKAAQLEGDVRLYVEMLLSESDNEARCSAVENLVQTISQDPLESDQVQLLVQSLHAIFQHDFSTAPFLTGVLTPEYLIQFNIN